MISENQEYTGAFIYKEGVTYTPGDIVIHQEGGTNVLYKVLAETSHEPSLTSLDYEEYAYGSAVKDIGTYDREPNNGKLVSCTVHAAVIKRAVGGISTSEMMAKIAKMQAIQAYESISYTLDGIVTDKVDSASGSTFKFNPDNVPDADITELDVFVTYAPSGSTSAAGFVYTQDMLRFVLTDRTNVYLRDYEDLSCSITKSGSTYTVSIAPKAGSVEAGTLLVERIEGVGTIISTDNA